MISVIIPVYNRVQPAIRAIHSVLAQDLQSSDQSFELMVVDDGSSDDLAAVRKLTEDNGGRFIRIDHAGVSAARNAGAQAAKGDWLAFLDSDDVWMPKKLAIQSEFHRQHPEYLISQTEEIWYRNGKRVNPRAHHQKPDGDAFWRSLELCCISPSAVMINRGLFLNLGGFDERFVVCEDYDLWLRISSEYPVPLIPQALLEKYGGHDDQLSKSQAAMDRFRIFALVKLLGKGSLTIRQREAVLLQIIHKSEVLVLGASKRGNIEVVRVYSELIRQSEIILTSLRSSHGSAYRQAAS